MASVGDATRTPSRSTGVYTSQLFWFMMTRFRFLQFPPTELRVQAPLLAITPISAKCRPIVTPSAPGSTWLRGSLERRTRTIILQPSERTCPRSITMVEYEFDSRYCRHRTPVAVKLPQFRNSLWVVVARFPPFLPSTPHTPTTARPSSFPLGGGNHPFLFPARATCLIESTFAVPTSPYITLRVSRL